MVTVALMVLFLLFGGGFLHGLSVLFLNLSLFGLGFLFFLRTPVVSLRGLGGFPLLGQIARLHKFMDLHVWLEVIKFSLGCGLVQTA